MSWCWWPPLDLPRSHRSGRVFLLDESHRNTIVSCSFTSQECLLRSSSARLNSPFFGWTVIISTQMCPQTPHPKTIPAKKNTLDPSLLISLESKLSGKSYLNLLFPVPFALVLLSRFCRVCGCVHMWVCAHVCAHTSQSLTSSCVIPQHPATLFMKQGL